MQRRMQEASSDIYIWLEKRSFQGHRKAVVLWNMPLFMSPLCTAGLPGVGLRRSSGPRAEHGLRWGRTQCFCPESGRRCPLSLRWQLFLFMFTCGKIHITQNLPAQPFSRVQVQCYMHSHCHATNPRTLSSCKIETVPVKHGRPTPPPPGLAPAVPLSVSPCPEKWAPPGFVFL